MKISKVLNVFSIFVMEFFSTVHCTSDTSPYSYYSQMAIKRKQPGLIPFPRIGRSSKEKVWRRYDFDSERNHKRKGLIPFPRVGRSNEQKNDADIDEIQIDLYRFDPAIFQNLQHSTSSKDRGLQDAAKKRMKKLEGLIPFPRVGKSVKQSNEGAFYDAATLWFDPKIRIHERGAFELENERPIPNSLESQRVRLNEDVNHWQQKQISENLPTDTEEK